MGWLNGVTVGNPPPSAGMGFRAAGWLGGVPVPQHVVPDLLHQLEGPGQRGAEYIDRQEVLVPGRHGGLHKYLLDVSHRGAHVLQKKRGQRGQLTQRGAARAHIQTAERGGPTDRSSNTKASHRDSSPSGPTFPHVSQRTRVSSSLAPASLTPVLLEHSYAHSALHCHGCSVPEGVTM